MSSSPTVGGRCNNFQPHHLRPDKCRSCFGEAKQHASSSDMKEVEVDASKDRDKHDSSPKGQQQCNKCLEKQAQVEQLKRELDQWQTRCGAAEQAAEEARNEVRLLEGEMEELHDNFKEEESEQFEQLKQELDAALKNCKILQIRLNKSERQYSQLEQVKVMLEKQLGESQQQERELAGMADAESLKRKAGSCEQPKQLYELGDDNCVKVPTHEYDQLLRDLNDTSERERDLQEQIKYSQEEAQLKGERLQAVEAENEVLLGRINKLTLANSSLRSSLMSSGSKQTVAVAVASGQQPQQKKSDDEGAGATPKVGVSSSGRDQNEKVRDLCEQNEQLKLALEVVQAECERVKQRAGELQQAVDLKERTIQELSSKLGQSETKLKSWQENAADSHDQSSSTGRFQLECRQLRARLAHSERECRQLRSQLEVMTSSRGGGGKQQESGGAGQPSRRLRSSSPRSQSMELPGDADSCSSSKCRETIGQLDKQCRSLIERNQQLETKLQRFIEFSNEDLDQKSHMESDLFAKLKRQLETSEHDLAKSKSRLVELDIECGRAQRQYKRLLSSLDTCGTTGGELAALRRNRLPQEEAARDAMTRQELRQAVRDLELDLADLIGIIKAKECLIKEQQQQKANSTTAGSGKGSDKTHNETAAGEGTFEQQVRSLRRLIDQEQLLSNNLKLDVASLERDNVELVTRKQMLERERAAMEEELDKLRQLSGEFRAELEESQREKEMALSKTRELNETLDRLRVELNQTRRREQEEQRQKVDASGKGCEGQAAGQSAPDVLLLARDLSELRVKNGFLMRQLEIAREEAARQLDELRCSAEAQLRRAVELAQIELKERQLQETQQLRDELNDSRQKLASLQRQTTRQEEEANLERDRARALERDWRRDKSQWQRSREQLEGQLAIEKRSSEFRLKEAEAAIRDKERQLINVQDRCVQLERDLKRLQNKFALLEEDSESKAKQLSRDLEMKTKELSELSGERRARDEQQFGMLKRLQDEKTTLKEALEAMRSSYDEKLVEARQLKELLHSRQEQSYRERSQQFERIETMTRRINELAEHESQAKLLRQRLEMQERQLESHRRDLVQLREDRSRLKARCDELEKRELITKTSSISGSSSSFFKPFGSPRAHLLGAARAASSTCEASKRAGQQTVLASGHQQAPASEPAGGGGTGDKQLLIEKLSGKINDQRNLINILRQQLTETQMELKQLKLLQSSERSKWQTSAALLTSRLNECEEKLAYETSLLNRSGALIEQLARPRLEASWARERQSSLELIQQQQGQMELLARDLKKTSQAHDLLRLHSRQLESQNTKLSRKLIEYQQQSNMFSLHDRELELDYERLARKSAQRDQELGPLLDIVGKIVASLDAPEQQQAPPAKLDSTDRPLRAGAVAARAERAYDSDDSSFELRLGSGAQVANAAPSPSRLTRLLAGGTKAPPSADQSNQKPQAKRTLKRVRVKCSTLGITTNEKKQLKQHLRALGETLAPVASENRRSEPTGGQNNKATRLDSRFTGQHERASAEPFDQHSSLQVATRKPTSGDGSKRSKSHSGHATKTNEADQSSQQSSHASRVHWQLDSDLESESSWSIAELAPGVSGRQDLYRRFPQTRPATRGHSLGPSMGASLTDYESESSLASDYSVSTFSPVLPAGRRAGAPSGAESDSGLLTGVSHSSKHSGGKLSSGRKLKAPGSGLKGRLTCTLRNISRSITGGMGGSDVEESPSTSSQEQRRSREAASTSRPAKLKEIRV